jgi:hypothetical protein
VQAGFAGGVDAQCQGDHITVVVGAEMQTDASPWLARSAEIQCNEARAGGRSNLRRVGQPRPMLGRLPWLAFERRSLAFFFLVFFDIGAPRYP